ncbi:hypothetical protein [Streptomyces sp. NPDC060027]|uniref:hypothetical protein n=1 Tax=Streptomyces sp. NPDC060027 TaxID=3347040 RepID=UPI00368C2ECB
MLTATASAVYSLHGGPQPDARSSAAKPTQAFFLLVQLARATGGDSRMLLAGVERMPPPTARRS